MFQVPFDFNPVRFENKTGLYQVPAGEYVRVTPHEFTADFTIDGIVKVRQRVFTGNASGTGGTVFTNNTPYTLKGTLSVNNAGNPVTIAAKGRDGGTLVSATGNGQSIKVELAPGDYMDSTSGGAGPPGIRWDLVADAPMVQASYWVPSGIFIDGDGFTVEIFKNKT